jgi:Tropinone reductase 1
MPTFRDALDLTGRLALVTGATKGIGLAVAREVASLGAEVIVVARDPDAVERTAADLGAIAVDADVATEAGRAAIRSTVGDRPLAMLVNNVGTNIRKPTEEFGVEDLRRLMSVNVESAFALCRDLRFALAAAAAEHGDAAIVNVSSIASRTIVGTSTCAYTMSKAALDAMSDWLAAEWGPDGIRSNVVHPWYIRTPLVAEVLEDARRRMRIEAATPLGRIGEPHEAARVIAFLASPAASYVSGAHVDIDGGFSRAGLPIQR